jgi:hypothetical protein
MPYFRAHPVLKMEVIVIMLCRVNVALFLGAPCYEEGRNRNYGMQGKCRPIFGRILLWRGA